MKVKKIISILCAASILIMSSGTSSYAESLPDETEVSTQVISEVDERPVSEEVSSEDIISMDELGTLSESDSNETNMLADLPDIAIPDIVTIHNEELQENSEIMPDMNSATLMGDMTTARNSRSANNLTQQFTDVITAEGDYKYVEFSLAEGEIFNASLVCPNNANLNYDLVLMSIAEDGSLTAIKASNLGTYIDPDTGKTADEGISYIHNQATVGNFAIFVFATTGSSSTDSFTLTISLDLPNSYDSHETNDSPFEATSISSLSTNGSLHVMNDQDWYMVSTTKGVYTVTAGNYQAEVYGVAERNRMVRALKTGSNYVLGNATYFVRVYSDDSQDNFTFGNYTLELTDQSKYATMQTAFDFGNWENSYTKRPEVIPRGQQQAYYKFTIDSDDKAYASLLFTQVGSGTLIEFLNNNGETMEYGYTGGSVATDIPVQGLIQKSNSSLLNLVVNIDSDQTNSVGYIRVTKADPLDISSGGTPSINDRIRSGYHTFRFSGTAKNSGNSISTVLSLDLTNSPYIPSHAIVDRISTDSSISYNVGGVHHQLNPGGFGWVQSSSTSAESGNFDFSSVSIRADQPWQFRYAQTALKSTSMSSVEMSIYWDYDIQYTNYEMFK